MGYRSEPHVASESMTETYMAMKLFIDNWRWAGVPFYLRTGKRMTRRLTEIVVQFKRAPFMLFRKTQVDRLVPNVLVIRIQPDEGISLRFDAKVPGPTVRIGTVDMDFQYADYFGNAPHTGYETLLARCHGRGRHAVPARRQYRTGLGGRTNDSRRVEVPSRTGGVPELPEWKLGATGGRGVVEA
jgi:glucose-6-phosphate 1-dehydrogenase